MSEIFNMAAGASEIVFGYQILLDKELGRGSFGTILEAINTESREVVAVKKISRTGSTNFAKTASKEAVNFQRLPKDHENIIKVYDTKYKDGSLYIFMEKCDAGDLNKYFATNFASIDVKQKINLMSQIADGLTYLHSQRIVHRDIKPANILIKAVSGQAVAKITDFGLSKFLGPEETSLMTSDVGTAAFMAPEFWNKGDDGEISYRSSVDVFAAGLVYLAILQATEDSNLRPAAEDFVGGSTEGSKHIGLVMFMRSTMNRPTLNVIASKPGDSDSIKKLKKMIRHMTSINPDERPKAADVDRLLKAIVTLIEFEDSTTDTEQVDEDAEDTQLKQHKVTINKLKQWKMEYMIQWMHVTKQGHIYTANPFGQIDLRDLSGKLLYQWTKVKLKGITSVTVDKREYIVIVVQGPDESSTAIKIKPVQSRSQGPDPWNVTVYETNLDSDIKTPLGKLQNGCVAIGLKQGDDSESRHSEIHILEYSSIPFKCVNMLKIESRRIGALCGIVSNSGQQMIACVTAFDGIKCPIVVYSIDSNEEVWRFTGQDVQRFEMRGILDKVRDEFERDSEKQGNPIATLRPVVHNLTQGLQPTALGPFSFQVDTAVSPLASAVLRQPNRDLLKYASPVCADIYFRFIATDLCAIDERNIFIAESENREVLLVDNKGEMLDKILTKEKLGEMAVDYMQCVLPSRYLVTVCSPRPIKSIGDQTMIIWRFSVN